ncbi:hypothetical protein KM043_004665 [Ampulex compressa]|nr:hypothetical protein KM043_004665 [Ampulex compressa]
MDDINTFMFYDDESDIIEQVQDTEYDYEYQEVERETFGELYQYCLSPTLYDTTIFMLPLFIATFIFRLCAHSRHVSNKTFHVISMIIGAYIVQHYAPECLYLLVILVLSSYATLYIPNKYYKNLAVFLPPILIILYCEVSMQPVVWHKIRGLVMTMAMKTISVAIDVVDQKVFPDVYSYMGYSFCGVTCLFGPWTPFKDYISIRQLNSQGKNWIFGTIQYVLIALFFLSMSNCWTQWLPVDNSWKWLLAYRDALSFRTSHYFVSSVATALLIFGGFPMLSATIVKPLQIEFPRSLVQVVIYWNIPMHFWLKMYIFRPSIMRLGKFGAVTVTYLTSALLHGLNFQLAAVLLSLGFYTYIEFQIRTMLATIFNACIASKGLAVFHLTYLGLMFDTSELQETGYSYYHTIEKWSQLGFASHWVAFATYCIYFLVR